MGVTSNSTHQNRSTDSCIPATRFEWCFTTLLCCKVLRKTVVLIVLTNEKRHQFLFHPWCFKCFWQWQRKCISAIQEESTHASSELPWQQCNLDAITVRMSLTLDHIKHDLQNGCCAQTNVFTAALMLQLHLKHWFHAYVVGLHISTCPWKITSVCYSPW